MPKKRDAIRMSEAEIWDLIRSSKNLQVATLSKDGSVQLTTLWFAIVDGAIVFETFTKSQKVVNLKRDPRIAVLVEDGTTYDQLRGVSIAGRGEIVDSGSRLEELMAVIVSRNTRGLDPDTLAGHVAAMIRKRVVVIVHAEKIISWDHRKLGAS